MQAERNTKHEIRKAWSAEVASHYPEDQRKTFLDGFVRFIQDPDRLFKDIPQSLISTRDEIIDSISRIPDFTPYPKGAGRDKYMPGDSNPKEILESMEFWCRGVAREVMKDESIRGAYPSLASARESHIAEAAEHFLLSEVSEVYKSDRVYGVAFLKAMPDMLNVHPEGMLTRPLPETLTQMGFLRRAINHQLDCVVMLRPYLKQMPFLKFMRPFSIDPQDFMETSDNLVALVHTRDPLSKDIYGLLALVDRVIPPVLDIHGLQAGDRVDRNMKYKVDAATYLIDIGSPQLRQSLISETMGYLRINNPEMALSNLRGKCRWDYTTYHILIGGPEASSSDIALNSHFPGVETLDAKSRVILKKLVYDNRNDRNHNDVMVPPLIRILNRHQRGMGRPGLEELADGFCSYVKSTENSYPEALEGMESESLEVKLSFMHLLEKKHSKSRGGINPAEANILKGRLIQAKGGHKISIIKEEEERVDAEVDLMLRPNMRK